jgi:hypothetical protein
MRYTSTLILALLVLAAATVIYIYRDQLGGPPKPPEKAAEVLPVLKDFRLEDVSEATLEESTTGGAWKPRLTLAHADGAWRLTAPVAWPADGFAVDRLLRAATDGKYRQSIEPGQKGAPTLAALGLEPPAYRLTLTSPAKDKEPARTTVIAIGKRSAIGEGLYIRVGDAPKVLVLERADLLEQARAKTDIFRSRELGTTRRDEIARIDLDGEKGLTELTHAADDPRRWVLAKPTPSRADPEAAAGLIRACLGLMVKDFVDDNPKDLAPYGLDKPRLTITLWKDAAAEKPKEAPKADAKPPAKPEPVRLTTLRFGAWADLKKQDIYVLTDDGKHVVTVSAANWKDLDKGPDALRDKHVLAVDLMKVSALSLKLPAKLAEGGKETAFDLTKTGDQWNVAPPGRPAMKADPAAVEALLQELANLKVMYFAEGDLADMAKTYVPGGWVRLTVEGAAAPEGLEIGQTPWLVKNLHEDWIGRVNETSLKSLRQDWLDYVAPEVLSVREAAVTGLAIQTPDRKEVFEKKNNAWLMVDPIPSDIQAGFVEQVLKALASLRGEKIVAATRDFKPYGLETGQVAVTVTQTPAKAGDPKEVTLRLARDAKGKVLGRTDSSDLVFEAPAGFFAQVVGEPVDRRMATLSEFEVNRVEVTEGAATLVLIQDDNKWFRADAAGRPQEEVALEPMQELVAAVTDLSAARWAAYDTKDLARFGLDKPALRMKVTTDRGETVILVSDKEVPADVAGLLDQHPARYAMIEGGPRIAIIGGRTADLIVGARRTFEPKKDAAKPVATATAP